MNRKQIVDEARAKARKDSTEVITAMLAKIYLVEAGFGLENDGRTLKNILEKELEARDGN